jgi:hypothetical protein
VAVFFKAPATAAMLKVASSWVRCITPGAVCRRTRRAPSPCFSALVPLVGRGVVAAWPNVIVQEREPQWTVPWPSRTLIKRAGLALRQAVSLPPLCTAISMTWPERKRGCARGAQSAWSLRNRARPTPREVRARRLRSLRRPVPRLEVEERKKTSSLPGAYNASPIMNREAVSESGDSHPSPG